MCLEKKTLQKSHVIPNSIFRKISRNNDGKFISWDCENDSEISYSDESWWSHKFCKECEQLLNNKYENYSLAVLRGSKVKLIKSQVGVRFLEIDCKKIYGFLISILWRSSISSHKSYSQVALGYVIEELMRECIINADFSAAGLPVIKISRLCDKSKGNSFSLDEIKQFICSPFARMSSSGHMSYCFVFDGFFVEFLICKVKIKIRDEYGLINLHSDSIFVPYLDIFSIEQVKESLLIGFGKYKSGLINNDVVFGKR